MSSFSEGAIRGFNYIQSMDASEVVMIDQWSLRQGLISLTIVSAIELVSQLPGMVSFILIPVSMLGYAICSIMVSAIAAFLLFEKRPKRAGSTFLAFLLPVLLWWPINWAANLAHLGLTVSLGIGQIGIVEVSKDGHFKAYDWSVGFAGGPSTLLIRDSTDRVFLATAPKVSLDDAGSTIEEICTARTRHLIGHYYVCVF